MSLIICTLLAIALPFVSAISLMKGKTLISFLSMSAGAYFLIAAIGIASTAT